MSWLLHPICRGQNRDSERWRTFPRSYSTVIAETEMWTPVWASLVPQMVKNPPAMWETQVQSLSQEDPVEKGTATHSSILAWIKQSPLPSVPFNGRVIFHCTYGPYLLYPFLYRWTFGMNICTLLCIKQIINRDLVLSTGKSTQCSRITDMRK